LTETVLLLLLGIVIDEHDMREGVALLQSARPGRTKLSGVGGENQKGTELLLLLFWIFDGTRDSNILMPGD
jgi:hypothetical protein